MSDNAAAAASAAASAAAATASHFVNIDALIGSSSSRSSIITRNDDGMTQRVGCQVQRPRRQRRR